MFLRWARASFRGGLVYHKFYGGIGNIISVRALNFQAMDDIFYCIIPILLAGLFLYNLYVWDFPGKLNENLVPVHKSKLNQFGLIFIFSGFFFIFAVFCLVWIYLNDRAIYWQFFYLHNFLIVVISCSILAACLVGIKWVGRQLGISGDAYQTYVNQRGLLGMIFAVTGAIFWVTAFLSFGDDFQLIDKVEIDDNVYNLVYVENVEGFAYVALYGCGAQNILCQRIAMSELDHCRSFYDSHLIYDQTSRELSAEVTSCFKYIGFVHVVE